MYITGCVGTVPMHIRLNDKITDVPLQYMKLTVFHFKKCLLCFFTQYDSTFSTFHNSYNSITDFLIMQICSHSVTYAAPKPRIKGKWRPFESSVWGGNSSQGHQRCKIVIHINALAFPASDKRWLLVAPLYICLLFPYPKNLICLAIWLEEGIREKKWLLNL